MGTSTSWGSSFGAGRDMARSGPRAASPQLVFLELATMLEAQAKEKGVGKVLPGVAALGRLNPIEDLSEADLKGKKVLTRCDLNVPLNGDLEITGETRITASVPTIEYLCSI